MNPLTSRIKTGTVGELLVQLRLLEYDVQAAPPLRDTGNDLIGVRGLSMRALQVKSSTRSHFTLGTLPENYDILATVKLCVEDEKLLLDESQVYLIPRGRLGDVTTAFSSLSGFELENQIDNLW